MPALNINCYVRTQQIEQITPLVQMNVLKDTITPLLTVPPFDYSANEGSDVFYLYRINTAGTKLANIPQGNLDDGFKGYIYIPVDKTIQNIVIYNAFEDSWAVAQNSNAIFNVNSTEIVSISYNGETKEYKRYTFCDPYDITNSLGANAYSFQIK